MHLYLIISSCFAVELSSVDPFHNYCVNIVVQLQHFWRQGLNLFVMATTHGALGEFCQDNEEWASYCERLEQYFLANDVASVE